MRFHLRSLADVAELGCIFADAARGMAVAGFLWLIGNTEPEADLGGEE